VVVDDESILQWGFKTLAAGALAALGWAGRWLHHRLVAVEEKVTSAAPTAKLDELRQEVLDGLDAHAAESSQGISNLRQEIRQDVQGIREEIRGARDEMNSNLQTILHHLLGRGSP